MRVHQNHFAPLVLYLKNPNANKSPDLAVFVQPAYCAMCSAAERREAARWCYTVHRPSAADSSDLNLVDPESKNHFADDTLTTYDSRDYLNDCTSCFTTSSSSSRSSSHKIRDLPHESVRRVRFQTDPGCSCSGVASHKSDCELLTSRRISLAALPSFKAAEDWPPSQSLLLPTKQVQKRLVGDVQQQQQHEEHLQQMGNFVNRLMTMGISVKQQHRWSRKRACNLTLAANKTLSWTAAERKCRSGTMQMSQVDVICREGCTVTIIPSTRALRQGHDTVFLFDNELEAILLEYTLKPMCNNASGSRYNNTSSAAKHSCIGSGGCSSSSSSSGSSGSSASSASGSSGCSNSSSSSSASSSASGSSSRHTRGWDLR
jgi:hypothetical protein